MTNFLQRKKVLIFFAFISVYVIWGSGYLLNKIAVQELDPLMLASVRFMTSGVIIFLISILLKFSLKISKKQLINSIIAGFLFLSGLVVGCLVHTLLLSFGFSIFILESKFTFNLLKLFGFSYIIFLAIQLYFSKEQNNFKGNLELKSSYFNFFKKGI